jgi:hypothetical protein
MTPKEKAEELVNKLLESLYDNGSLSFKRILFAKAKQCALIAVDLAIEAATSFLSQEIAFEKSKEYWYNVKIEIVKL